MNENQFCGAADADGIPSFGAVDAEGGSPFLDVADVVGENPFCDAVGVGDASPFCGAVVDVIPFCGAVDEAPACCGWYVTALTGVGVAADETGRWENPSGSQQLENAVVVALVFSEDKGFLHAPVASSGAPFGSVVASENVRTHADYVTSAVEQGDAGYMGHPGHSGRQNLNCHGDGGGSAPVQYSLFHHCSCYCQQTSHFFAAVDDDVVDAVAS